MTAEADSLFSGFSLPEEPATGLESPLMVTLTRAKGRLPPEPDTVHYRRCITRDLFDPQTELF